MKTSENLQRPYFWFNFKDRSEATYFRDEQAIPGFGGTVLAESLPSIEIIYRTTWIIDGGGHHACMSLGDDGHHTPRRNKCTPDLLAAQMVCPRQYPKSATETFMITNKIIGRNNDILRPRHIQKLIARGIIEYVALGRPSVTIPCEDGDVEIDRDLFLFILFDENKTFVPFIGLNGTVM